MIDYKSYKYALLGGSTWLKLYRTKEDYITVYSEESGQSDAISMDDFNAIGDHFMNSGYDFLSEEELYHAMENNLHWMLDENNKIAWAEKTA